MADHSYRYTCKSQVWLSPPEFIEGSREVFGGFPDLDPASTEADNVLVNAKRIITPEQDGLVCPWECAGLSLWMNPPGGTVKIDNLGREQSTAGVFWGRIMDYLADPEERFKHAIVVGFNLEILRSSQNYGHRSAATFPHIIPKSRTPFYTRDLERGTQPSHPNVLIYVPGLEDHRALFFHAYEGLGEPVNPGPIPPWTVL